MIPFPDICKYRSCFAQIAKSTRLDAVLENSCSAKKYCFDPCSVPHSIFSIMSVSTGTSGNTDASQTSRRRNLLAVDPEAARIAAERNNQRTRTAEPDALQPMGTDRAPTQAQTYSAIKAIINEELGEYLTPQTKAAIRKQGSELSKDIDSLQKTNEKIKSVGEDLKHLNEKGSMPKGSKAISFGFETALLDDIPKCKPPTDTICEMLMELINDFKADESLTLRKMKTRLHLKHFHMQRLCDEVLFNSKRVELRGLTKRKTFVEK